MPRFGGTNSFYSSHGQLREPRTSLYESPTAPTALLNTNLDFATVNDEFRRSIGLEFGPPPSSLFTLVHASEYANMDRLRSYFRAMKARWGFDGPEYGSDTSRELDRIRDVDRVSTEGASYGEPQPHQLVMQTSPGQQRTFTATLRLGRTSRVAFIQMTLSGQHSNQPPPFMPSNLMHQPSSLPASFRRRETASSATSSTSSLPPRQYSDPSSQPSSPAFFSPSNYRPHSSGYSATYFPSNTLPENIPRSYHQPPSHTQSSVYQPSPSLTNASSIPSMSSLPSLPSMPSLNSPRSPFLLLNQGLTATPATRSQSATSPLPPPPPANPLQLPPLHQMTSLLQPEEDRSLPPPPVRRPATDLRPAQPEHERTEDEDETVQRKRRRMDIGRVLE